MGLREWWEKLTGGGKRDDVAAERGFRGAGEGPGSASAVTEADAPESKSASNDASDGAGGSTE